MTIHEPRSRGLQRRKAMLAVATDLFLERGFAATTVDDVITRSGGSRATLYDEFGDKEGLFAAIIELVCARMVVPLQDETLCDGGPAEALTAFGVAFLEALLEPSGVQLFRVVAAESARFPDLGRRVFAAGPAAAEARLCSYLREAERRGELRLNDTAMAARLFLEMIKGDLHTRALFGVPPMPTSSDIEATVTEAVHIFLEGYGPKL